MLDVLEAWDTNGNGIANTLPSGGDADIDGLDNAFDDVVGPNSTTNTYNNEDAEDFPNEITLGTTELDWREDNAVDSDGDGQINSNDIDDDDGILDTDEGNGDFDNDGIPNNLDLDSDNDGIPDIIEAGGVDTNNDGRVEDNTDIDSDGDGIVDLIEAQASTIIPGIRPGDGDGIDNAFDDDAVGGIPTVPVDTDGDGAPDYIDFNSDNDSYSDALEGWDTDNNQVAETVPDGLDSHK